MSCDKSEFEPCPMCGAPLNWVDNFDMLDEEGCPCSDACCRALLISCPCGYHFVKDAFDIKFPFGNWQEEFVKLANRRVSTNAGVSNTRFRNGFIRPDLDERDLW